MQELVAFLESLERQIEPVPIDLQRHQHLLTCLHPHLRDALLRHDKIGRVREQLEEAAIATERTEPSPAGITVKTASLARRYALANRGNGTKTRRAPHPVRPEGRRTNYLGSQTVTSTVEDILGKETASGENDTQSDLKLERLESG